MKRILVIDDEEQMLGMTRKMLERAGYSVATAPDGVRGLELLRKGPFDLVVTDIFMPEKEGIETICELRKGFPTVKIIAISGGGTTGMISFLPLAKRLGADLTMKKPFETAELLGAVQQLLGGKAEDREE